MVAGFKGYIKGPPRCGFPGIMDGVYFGMRTAGGFVIPPADNLAVLNDDGPHHGIG